MRVFRVYGTWLSITEIWGPQCIRWYVAVRVAVLMTKVTDTYRAKLFSVCGAPSQSGMFVCGCKVAFWVVDERGLCFVRFVYNVLFLEVEIEVG